MGKKTISYLIFLTLLISNLQSQELIALHPMKGPAEEETITSLFFQRLQRELPNAGDGNYSGFPIDLTQLPSDVPPGGFPPWICPSPSITGDAAYAMTGEASPDLDYEGAFRMRLYLWRMDGARLLGSDELTIMNLQDLETLSGFLEWVLSWIGEEVDAPEPVIVYVGLEEEQLTYEANWLYLGLRGGGGYARWTYDFRNDTLTHEATSMASGNIALQAAVYFTRFFGVQTEANFIADFIMGKESFTSLNLHIPVLLKLTLRGERVKAGIFGGAYLHLPLTRLGDEDLVKHYHYRSDLPGFVFGLSSAWRLGPGNIFIDGRFEYDGHWFNPDVEMINYRNSVRLNIGYEIGFFRKR